MAPKRTSVGGKAGASPAKKQRVCQVAADPLLEACAPVLKVLQAAEDTTTELLCAALPCALKAVDGAGRHAYQETMLEAVSARLSELAAAGKESVAGLDTEKAALEAEQAESGGLLEQITARLAQKTKERDEAGEGSQTRRAEVDAAQASLTSAKEKAASAEGEKQNLENDRDVFAKELTELFAPLKNAEVTGAKWRIRDKMLERLVANMKLAGAVPSLQVALPVALKLKVEARPAFAQSTVAHAEDLYTKHIEVLKEKVVAFGAEIDSRAAALAQAEGVATTAQAALDAAQEADIAAQNAWVEVGEEERIQQAKMNKFGPSANKLEKKLDKARAEAAHLQEILDGFVALRPVAAVLKKMAGEDEAPATAPDAEEQVQADA